MEFAPCVAVPSIAVLAWFLAGLWGQAAGEHSRPGVRVSGVRVSGVREQGIRMAMVMG